jgi:hypothetical protein
MGAGLAAPAPALAIGGGRPKARAEHAAGPRANCVHSPDLHAAGLAKRGVAVHLAGTCESPKRIQGILVL